MSSVTSFSSLRDSHNSANELLHSPRIQHALVHSKQEHKWVQKVSDSSLRLLDSCGATKDFLVLVKDHIQQLRNTFRRVCTLGGMGIHADETFLSHHLYRKGLKEGMLKRLKSLKKMKNITTDPSRSDKYNIPNGHNLMVVVNVLSEVRVTIVSLLESLMLFMSMPSPNPDRIPSNRVAKAKAKFTRANSLSSWGKCDRNTLWSAIDRLEAVESAMEDLEIELECIFKRVIRTRVLLLNILSN